MCQFLMISFIYTVLYTEVLKNQWTIVNIIITNKASWEFNRLPLSRTPAILNCFSFPFRVPVTGLLLNICFITWLLQFGYHGQVLSSRLPDAGVFSTQRWCLIMLFLVSHEIVFVVFRKLNAIKFDCGSTLKWSF